MTIAVWYWLDSDRPLSEADSTSHTAAELIRGGCNLRLVSWDVERGWLRSLEPGQVLPASFRGGWLVIPRPLTYLGAPDPQAFLSEAHSRNLRTAILIDDDASLGFGPVRLLPDEEEAAARFVNSLPSADLVAFADPAIRDAVLGRLWADAGRTAAIEQRFFTLNGGEPPDYGARVAQVLHLMHRLGGEPSLRPRGRGAAGPSAERRSLPAPLLSLCISTYNRGAWLRHSLTAALDLTRNFHDLVEVLVVDNASGDITPEVIRSAPKSPNLRYIRNKSNVGMLGNLCVTARAARGQYVWIIGDDDIAMPGAVERILLAIATLHDVPLMYLNYSYTRCDDPGALTQYQDIYPQATQISHATDDEFAYETRLVATRTENCFTAIYACVFRKDHAVAAYCMDTSGPPFSSLNTCVPSAVHVVNELFHGPCVWLGQPCVVVNMHVSWSQHAATFVLERLPELYDIMEAKGADRDAVDGIRQRSVANVLHFLANALSEKAEPTGVSLERVVGRYKHIADFRAGLPAVMDAYRRAQQAGRLPRLPSADQIIEKYGLNVP